jgi:hypothetical protein
LLITSNLSFKKVSPSISNEQTFLLRRQYLQNLNDLCLKKMKNGIEIGSGR